VSKFCTIKNGAKIMSFCWFCFGGKNYDLWLMGTYQKNSSNIWPSQVNKHQSHQAQWVIIHGCEKNVYV